MSTEQERLERAFGGIYELAANLKAAILIECKEKQDAHYLNSFCLALDVFESDQNEISLIALVDSYQEVLECIHTNRISILVQGGSLQ